MQKKTLKPKFEQIHSSRHNPNELQNLAYKRLKNMYVFYVKNAFKNERHIIIGQNTELTRFAFQ
jgi:hypothetical protein